MVCPCHYSYHYRYFSNWNSFKTHLIWAHLKFRYRLLFCSTSAAIPEPKFFSSTFSLYPIPLWQRMKNTYMLFLFRQRFLPPFFYFQERTLSSVFWLRSILKQFKIISDTHEEYFGNISEYDILEICIREVQLQCKMCHLYSYTEILILSISFLTKNVLKFIV